MFKACTVYLVLFAVSMNFNSYAEQIATLPDGRTVVLFENGTWRFANQGDLQQLDKQKRTGLQDKPVSVGVSNSGKIDPAQKRISLVDIVRNDTSFDFRSIRWGMSKGQVKGAEKAKLIKETESLLEYEVSFLGYDCRVAYTFLNDKVRKAAMQIKQDHIDPARYYRDYEDLRNYLSPLYGKPIADKYDWKNEMYRNDPSKYGFAVSIGFLSCRTTWMADNTEVALIISGGSHQISTNLEYAASSR